MRLISRRSRRHRLQGFLLAVMVNVALWWTRRNAGCRQTTAKARPTFNDAK
jgi:hypothetical protein